jgi:hypothetical protein
VVVVDVGWDGAAEAASAADGEWGAKGAVLIGVSGGKPSSAEEAIAVGRIGGSNSLRKWVELEWDRITVLGWVQELGKKEK